MVAFEFWLLVNGVAHGLLAAAGLVNGDRRDVVERNLVAALLLISFLDFAFWHIAASGGLR